MNRSEEYVPDLFGGLAISSAWDMLTWMNQLGSGFGQVLDFGTYKDAGRGDGHALAAPFQKVKKR